MKVLIVDQFSGVSPYDLQRHPVKFDDICREILSAKPPSYGQKASLEEVPDDYEPRFCTTVIAADENGNAYAWRYNWDSSG